MMRLIFIILLLPILITSCEQSESTHGVWQISYRVTDYGRINSVTDKNLFDFEDDTLSIVQIGNSEADNYRELVIEKYAYTIQDSLLLIYFDNNSPDTVFLSCVTNDSICFRIKQLNETTILKRAIPRIQDNLPVKSDLIGKAFRYTIGDDSERRLNFLNDSVYLLDSDYYAERWTILRYKNFDFLSSSNSIYFPDFSLTKTDDGILKLSGHYTKPFEFSLSPVAPKYIKDQIPGEWTEIERSFDPPIFPDAQTNSINTLKITKELFTRKQLKPLFSSDWKLSPDGEVIYFPEKDGKRFYSERILELSDSSLVLYRLNQQNRQDSLAITYRKTR
ncbi:MAG: hypothetical protein WBA74_23615 [Cyclobacteriaceae bacterium]